MRLIIEPTYDAVSRWAANYVASCINKFNPTEEKPFVLGLPTGSSPLGMYKHLIELNKKGVVSFRNVVTFNMDEYCNLPEDHEQSYHTFMWSNFFSHIDIRPENVNILNGNAANPEEECARYEAKIASYGGIELFLGGVGPDGHIAFNEPGSSLTSTCATIRPFSTREPAPSYAWHSTTIRPVSSRRNIPSLPTMPMAATTTK